MNGLRGAINFGWGIWRATFLAAMVLLPMAPLTSVAQEKPEATATAKAPQKRAAEKKQRAPFPEYRASPANGTTGVDPSVKEIVLRFDRDMNDSMSVTGDPKLLPPLDPGAKPRWRNARTFVLPVKLAEGAYYRVGINSKSHQKFRSSDGTPAPPTVIAFTTKGASKELEARLATPKVAATEPAIGAKDIDAGITELKVTFDVPMGDGMSFVGDVPGLPGGRPTWSEDGKTITLPIKLEPGQAYQFGLNSPRHVNFQSAWGVPLEPVVFEFSTKK